MFAWHCSIFITSVYKDCLFCCNLLSLDLHLCFHFQTTYFLKPLYPISCFCMLLRYFTCKILKVSLLSMWCLFPRHSFPLNMWHQWPSTSPLKCFSLLLLHVYPFSSLFPILTLPFWSFLKGLFFFSTY